MARTRSEPWKTFATWLVAPRGLTSASVSTYLTQVRRMLAHAPLTSEGLAEWVATLPAHHRSPHRTAWRCYVAWSASVGEEVPDLVVSEPAVDVPDDVVAAVALLVSASHLKPRDLAGMTWGMRVHSEAKEHAFPDRMFFTAPAGVTADYALLLREPLAVVTRWAYGDDAPSVSAPLLPRSPGDVVPMAPTTVQRLLREHRRAAA